MKRKLLSLLAAGVLLLLAGCTPNGGTGGADTSSADSLSAYHKITAAEAKEMMDGGMVTVVDVRTKEEYDASHVPDAVLVQNETIASTQPAALPDKDAILLVYCRTGVRSKQASDKLVNMGYKNVYDFGGIVDWPYDTVTE